MSDINPILGVNFAGSKQLHQAITFSRASVRDYVDNNGATKTAKLGVPRFTHNPATGESLGLLFQPQETVENVVYAGDVCFADLTAIKDNNGNALWTGSEGSFVVDFEIQTPLTPGVTVVVAQLWYDAANRIALYGFGADQTLRATVVSGGISRFDSAVFQNATAATRYRFAFGFSATGVSASVNGGPLVSGGEMILPTAAFRLDFFSYNLTPLATGVLRSFKLYNRRTSDVHLKLLSAL